MGVGDEEKRNLRNTPQQCTFLQLKIINYLN